MSNVADLHQENEHLKAQIHSQQHYIKQLEEALLKARQQRFGASSEKQSPDQITLFNEAETDLVESDEIEEKEHTTTVQSHTRKKRQRIAIPDNIEREDITYDLTDSEKVCPLDGTTLKPIGEDTHEQLDIIPAKLKAIRHIRKKYACPCCEQYVVTAKKPKQPIEKSIASPGLLAYIATNKYCDALPLYRQTELFKRIGIDFNRTQLANWMIKTGELIQPLINLMQDHIRQQSVMHLDETTVQVLKEQDKTAQSKSYMWVMACYGQQPAVLYHYAPSRSGVVAENLLQGTPPNTAVIVDGYEGYQKACDTQKLKRLGCWAHARRRFVNVQKLTQGNKKQKGKNKVGKADQALAFIQKLYAVERQIKDKPIDERYQIRQAQSKPVVEKLRQWLDKNLPHTPPKVELGKAMSYLHEQWPRLVGYLENGAYPIDNNPVENSIRPFTVGRKNWLFSNSQAGAHASANLYSLIETAKANDHNPYEYLKEVFAKLPNADQVEEIENLLPWQVELTSEMIPG